VARPLIPTFSPEEGEKEHAATSGNASLILAALNSYPASSLHPGHGRTHG
jgi:hypothetical protein